MKKNINEEVNRLLTIQRDIEEINRIRIELSHFVFVFQDTYDNLSEKIRMSDLIFYIVPENITEYIEEDSVILENDKIFIIRDGECVNTVELSQ